MTGRPDDLDIDLIRSAQSADPEDQSELAKRVTPRIYTYIYRMTLDAQLSEDLCQETLLMLVKSLPTLEIEHVRQFWGWLYRTALTRIQRHFRVHGNRRIKLNLVGDSDVLLRQSDEKPSALPRLMHSEAHQAVIHALSELQLRYRSVLTLRCLDQLSYAEIAAIMGGSEMQVRLWFFRAKQSLKRKLVKKGLAKDCLLSALGTFAYLTASESQKATAATALTVGSLKSTWTTVLLGTATSKTGLGALGLLVTMALVVTLTFLTVAGSGLTAPSAPAPTVTPVPDDSLILIFDDATRPSGYTRLAQVSRSNHPADEDWKHFVFWPQLEPARMLKSPIDDTACSLLVLGKDRWIEYELPRALQDRPGPEVAVYLCNWGAPPAFFVTDGQSQQVQIYPSTRIGSYPHGEMGLGFDLSGIDCPFVIRGIRIVGSDNAGPYGGCGVDPPKVYLEALDPVFRGKTLLGDD